MGSLARVRPIEETVVLITGATDGLGRGVARDLAARGAQVLLHGRSREKLDALSEELGGVPTFQADFASLEEVRGLAAEVESSTGELHVLVNNAGIGSGRPDGTTRQESRDGHELRLAVNHLAGFLLTVRLLPLLRRSAPARIVFVASLGQAPMDFDDPMLERGYSGTRAYGQSKLAQITTGFELAERLDPGEVAVTSLHPSTYMPTKMVLEERGASVDTLEEGIAATSRLAVDPELDGVTGRFYDREREAEPDPQATDPEARKRLWALSLELVGEPEPAL
jgi:NAD(P)-dependent dehydrogenase (short-subunit alcohol dehydrogenase family)